MTDGGINDWILVEAKKQGTMVTALTFHWSFIAPMYLQGLK